MRKIRLTKIRDDSETPDSIKLGVSIDGTIDEKSSLPQKPTRGVPFIIGTYRTRLVKEILTEDTFRTHDGIYKWEEIN